MSLLCPFFAQGDLRRFGSALDNHVGIAKVWSFWLRASRFFFSYLGPGFIIRLPAQGGMWHGVRALGKGGHQHCRSGAMGWSRLIVLNHRSRGGTEGAMAFQVPAELLRGGQRIASQGQEE